MRTADSQQPQVQFLSDDAQASRARLAALGAWNIVGDVVTQLEEASAACADGRYDLLVIDVHTHDFDGIAACRHLRGYIANPLLLVAYGDDERDKIAAYQAGVDEFIAKPIGLPLFVCKVQAWLRHSWTIPAAALRQREIDGVHLDPAGRQITVNDSVIPLTNLELRLLHILMAQEGHVLSGEQLVAQLWRHNSGDKGMLKNVVYRLRRKIEQAPGAPRFLHTASGKGYLFAREEPGAESKESAPEQEQG